MLLLVLKKDDYAISIASRMDQALAHEEREQQREGKEGRL